MNRQEVLNSATTAAKQHLEAVKNYKVKEETYFEHRRERERLAMQVKLLQQHLQEQQILEEAGMYVVKQCYQFFGRYLFTKCSTNRTEVIV